MNASVTEQNQQVYVICDSDDSQLDTNILDFCSQKRIENWTQMKWRERHQHHTCYYFVVMFAITILCLHAVVF